MLSSVPVNKLISGYFWVSGRRISKKKSFFDFLASLAESSLKLSIFDRDFAVHSTDVEW